MSVEQYKLKSLKDKLREQEEARRVEEVVDAVVDGKEVPKGKEIAKSLKVESKINKDKK